MLCYLYKQWTVLEYRGAFVWFFSKKKLLKGHRSAFQQLKMWLFGDWTMNREKGTVTKKIAFFVVVGNTSKSQRG